MKRSGIYCITNTATAMQYVGSAVDLDGRFKRHIREMKTGTHPNKFLLMDYERHGEESFRFEVLELCSDTVLLEREQHWIDQLGTAVTGYNIALTAGSPMKGRKQSEATRAKMREAHRNRKPISEETRQRLRDAAKRREEAKKLNGFTVSEETRKKLSEAGMGHAVSEETREKLRKANSRPYRTPAQEAQREALKVIKAGNVVPESQRRIQSEKMKLRWQDPDYVARVTAGRLKRTLASTEE